MSLSSLLEDIQVEILLKLPASSVLACKYVCKLWFTLVSKPEFIKNHHHRAIQRNSDRKLLLSHYDSTRPGDEKPAISSIDYASILPLSLSSDYECDGEIPVDYPISPFRQEDVKFLRILGSCNGLICLGIVTYDCDATRICIWNPTTKEYKQIPRCGSPSSDKNWSYAKYGFGFDNNSDDYKVVRIPWDNYCESSVIQVYTMGSDSWHEVQTIPYWLRWQERSSLPFFNGALHWLGYTTQGTSSDFIVSFELSNERLAQLPFPEKNRKDWDDSEKVFTSVGVLRDCNCLNIGYTDDHIDIWVMQDYGVPESWTKRFTFSINLHDLMCCRPIWSFENGDILLDGFSNFFIYDPRSGKVRMAMPIRHSYKSRDVEFYVESLVSVKSNTCLKKLIKMKLEGVRMNLEGAN
ncbi:F-box/kelch-repeat protein At3g23880-like [Papaver somniferum]|uniref:F-box/kelch-repeat protein At3g23880-like n=1 Tax=Papaver somniferum TaxID=3469 RepID=UPI000E6F8179|nr:F-box/kelch-repeat protein At3g23880-like [Papaver somniferum]